MSDDATIKAVQQRMQQVRHDLGDEVEHLVESAKDITDWRKYVRANPWACVAAAAAVGFLVVPRRRNVVKLDEADLKNLARHSKVYMSDKAQRKESLARTIFTMAATTAIRGALGYLGQRVAQANMETMGEHRHY